MTDISTRVAQAADAAEIARLNFAFNQVNMPPESYAERLEDSRRVDTPVLAEVNGQVVGILNLRILQPVFYETPYAEITELFVEEAYRRRGVGRALMEHAERIARAQGASSMIVLTDYYNHTAQQLYRSIGYEHYDIALSKDLDDTHER